MRRELVYSMKPPVNCLQPVRIATCLLLALVLVVGAPGTGWADDRPSPTTEPREAIITPPLAPADTDSRPARSLTFAVLGNCHPGSPAAYSPILYHLAVELGPQQVDFVLGTGNYIEGSLDETILRQQYQGLFYALQPLQLWRKIPVAFAPGQRDIWGSRLNAQLFSQYFGGCYYSFDRGPAHFLVLDTEVPGQQGRIMGDQWSWLLDDLHQAQGYRFLFVVMHRPLFPVASARGRSLDRYPSYRDSLHQLFAQYRVSAVFSGAESLYHYQERDGVKYFITGGAGAALDTTAPLRTYHHYLLVTCQQASFTVRLKPVLLENFKRLTQGGA